MRPEGQGGAGPAARVVSRCQREMVLRYGIVALTTTIDGAGRIVVPQALRQQLGLAPGTRLRLEVEGERLVIVLDHPDPVLREDGGLLIVEAPLEGEIPDHRDLRAERAAKVTR